MDSQQEIRMLRLFRRGTFWARQYHVWSPLPEGGQYAHAAKMIEAQIARKAAYMGATPRADIHKAVPDAPLYVVYHHDDPIAWLTLSGEVVAPVVPNRGSVRNRRRVAAREALKQVTAAEVAALRAFG